MQKKKQLDKDTSKKTNKATVTIKEIRKKIDKQKEVSRSSDRRLK